MCVAASVLAIVSLLFCTQLKPMKLPWRGWATNSARNEDGEDMNACEGEDGNGKNPM